MKTLTLLFLSALLITGNATGQFIQNIDNPKHEFSDIIKGKIEPNLLKNDHLNRFDEPIILSRDVLDLFRIDSVISYSFENGSDSGSYLRKIYTYDDINHTIDYVTLRRANENYEWENMDRNLLTFNDKGQQTQLINYNWDHNEEEWINVRKTDYIYDDDNNSRENIRFDWKQEQWIGDRKTLRVYNVNGDEISQTSRNWDVESGSWLNETKVLFDYNAQGLNYRFVIFTTDSETNNWKFLVKDSTCYNSLDQETAWYRYYWNETLLIWEVSFRNTYTYDSDVRSNYYDYWQDNEWKHWSKNIGYRISSMTIGYNGYNFVGDSVWLHNFKSEITFDEFGNTVLYESYRIPEGYTDWRGETKHNKLYDETGLITASYYYNWDYENEEWFYKELNEVGYNDDGISDYNCVYLWYLDKWVKYESKVKYYSNISSITDHDSSIMPIKVSPNPCVDFLRIESNDLKSNNVTYEIYSSGGSLIGGGLLKHDGKIDTGYLTKGYYHLRISDSGVYYSATFLKL